MIRRFYLIPIDADGTAPQYLDAIGRGFGYPSPARGHYIVAADRELADDFAAMEAQPGVQRIWRESYAEMAAMGVDTAGLTADSTDAEIGARVLAWLQLDINMSVYGVV